jgi:hypothetical protein
MIRAMCCTKAMPFILDQQIEAMRRGHPIENQRFDMAHHPSAA